ncbi:MAG: glycoside hydrolase family 97 protein [Carboxylicivirga sp.]|jgi:alpha-glucosidase|nr:glycoside hydrolase family 97 protein [Carboxylicivirga sp.]
MKKLTHLLVLMFGLFIAGQNAYSQKSYEIQSPDKQIKLSVIITDKIYYQVGRNKQVILNYSPMSMALSTGQVLGLNPVVEKANERSVNEEIKPVWGITSKIADNYNELKLKMKGHYSLVFRAYNDGVAYRFVTNFKNNITVTDEEVLYRFVKNEPVLAHIVEHFQTSFEKFFTRTDLHGLDTTLVSMPLVTNGPNYKVAITESDLYDYPGMYLTRQSTIKQKLVGVFPKAAKKTELSGFALFNDKVIERHNYLAKTKGTRAFPWRVMIITEDDKGLANNNLVYQLARPAAIDTDWIQPGKVVWDWWNDWNLTGVDFEAGVNNKTYEYYIDFAANNNIPYVILDEGWSYQFDVLLPVNEIDVPHLVNYAKERGVKLMLWCVWHTLDRQLGTALDLFEKWGIAGIKVDFIDRDDQYAINYYERVAKAAAERKLLVDFHGCSKPTGLHRTYPNLINFEGVRGNEWNKFDPEGNPPGHGLDLIFTRMITGPMDYTPGAMNNSIKAEWLTKNTNTASQGTRVRELAMYVTYFSPLQMLCDAPTQYEKYPDILDFLSDVPVSWDETVVLEAEIGKKVVMARRKGNDWYIGAMTDWNEREVSVNLDFLANGQYDATLFLDGVNANKNAEDYQVKKQIVSNATQLPVTMKQGGGAVIVLKKK